MGPAEIIAGAEVAAKTIDAGARFIGALEHLGKRRVKQLHDAKVVSVGLMRNGDGVIDFDGYVKDSKGNLRIEAVSIHISKSELPDTARHLVQLAQLSEKMATTSTRAD